MLRRSFIFIIGAAAVLAACTDSTGPPADSGAAATAAREQGSLHGLQWRTDTDFHGRPVVPTPAPGLSSISAQPVLSYTDAGLTASFWAVRGERRFLQLNYAAPQAWDDDDGDDDEWDDDDGDDDGWDDDWDDDDGARGWYVGTGAPLVRLDIPARALARYPDGPRFGWRDSVLITLTLDADRIQVELEPDGLTFSPRRPAMLRIWYGAANGDLNGNGRVDAQDAHIEAHLLGLWTRDEPGGDWLRLDAEHSLKGKWFRAELQHFSGYEVSW